MEGCLRSVNGDAVITSVHLISSSSLFPFCVLPCLPPSWPLTGLAAASWGCHRLMISPRPAAPSAGKSWLQAGQSVPIITPKSSSPGEHVEKTGFNAAQCLKRGNKDCRGVQAVGVCLHSALGQTGKAKCRASQPFTSLHPRGQAVLLTPVPAGLSITQAGSLCKEEAAKGFGPSPGAFCQPRPSS